MIAFRRQIYHRHAGSTPKSAGDTLLVNRMWHLVHADIYTREEEPHAAKGHQGPDSRTTASGSTHRAKQHLCRSKWTHQRRKTGPSTTQTTLVKEAKDLRIATNSNKLSVPDCCNRMKFCFVSHKKGWVFNWLRWFLLQNKKECGYF